MPAKEHIDPVARERISKWVEYFKFLWKATNDETADRLGLSEPTVTNIVNRTRTPGLDVLLKIVANGRVRPDEVLGSDPPHLEELRAKYYDNPHPVDRGGHGGRRRRSGGQR